jgi:hypothetical protein
MHAAEWVRWSSLSNMHAKLSGLNFQRFSRLEDRVITHVHMRAHARASSRA